MRTYRIESAIRVVFAAAFVLAGVRYCSAQVADMNPQKLQGIDVVEHSGEQIPLDLSFIDDHGDSVVLGDYFNKGKPVVLVLAYYECPMLCTYVLNGVSDAARQLGWSPGDKFQIVTISINPLEDYKLAAGKKKVYLENLALPVIGDGWAFLVGEESQSRALADAVGFKYFYDEKIKQYAHPAVVFILTPEGKISRYLYGIQYSPRDLKLSLLEASGGKIGNTIDRVILYCYHYDPDAGGYVVFATNFMKVGGILSLLVLAGFLTLLWRFERSKKSATSSVDQEVKKG